MTALRTHTIGDGLRAELWRAVMQDWLGIAGHWGPALEGQGIPEKRGFGRGGSLWCVREDDSEADTSL